MHNHPTLVRPTGAGEEGAGEEAAYKHHEGQPWKRNLICSLAR